MLALLPRAPHSVPVGLSANSEGTADAIFLHAVSIGWNVQRARHYGHQCYIQPMYRGVCKLLSQ